MRGFSLFKPDHSSLTAAAFLATALTAYPVLAEEMVGMTDFVSPDAPGTHVMTFVVDLKAGEDVPMHSHGGDGVVMVLQGEAVVTGLDGTTATYKTGDTFAEPAGEVHGARVSDSGPARVIWTIVLPDGKELETPYSG